MTALIEALHVTLSIFYLFKKIRPYSEMDVIKIGEKYKGKPIDLSNNWEDKFWITKK